MEELQAAVDALDDERRAVPSVANAAVAEVPFPFQHIAFPPPRHKRQSAAPDGTAAATSMFQADCRRVAASFERWLNEALQAIVPLVPLSLLDETTDDRGRDGEKQTDPAEHLVRKFLLLPKNLELYGHQVPD